MGDCQLLEQYSARLGRWMTHLCALYRPAGTVSKTAFVLSPARWHFDFRLFFKTRGLNSFAARLGRRLFVWIIRTEDQVFLTNHISVLIKVPGVSLRWQKLYRRSIVFARCPPNFCVAVYLHARLMVAMATRSSVADRARHFDCNCLISVELRVTSQKSFFDCQCNPDSADTSVCSSVLPVEATVRKGLPRNGVSIHWLGLDNWVSIIIQGHKGHVLTWTSDSLLTRRKYKLAACINRSTARVKSK